MAQGSNPSLDCHHSSHPISHIEVAIFIFDTCLQKYYWYIVHVPVTPAVFLQWTLYQSFQKPFWEAVVAQCLIFLTLHQEPQTHCIFYLLSSCSLEWDLSALWHNIPNKQNTIFASIRVQTPRLVQENLFFQYLRRKISKDINKHFYLWF